MLVQIQRQAIIAIHRDVRPRLNLLNIGSHGIRTQQIDLRQEQDHDANKTNKMPKYDFLPSHTKVV